MRKRSAGTQECEPYKQKSMHTDVDEHEDELSLMAHERRQRWQSGT